MGKRGGKKGGRGRGGRGQSGGGPPRRAQRAQRQEIERRNTQYEQYYNELGIVPEGEREVFWAAMRRDLPNSFRFTGSKGHALAVQERLKDFYIPEIVSIRHEGEFVEAPKPVDWFPDQLAWYMTVPKTVIRRFAPFASFQRFLVAETDVGNISRQEVVSMIPPLLMDIKPGMTVLDLCAAPGSKSAQLIEMVHAGEEDRTREAAERVRKGTDIPDGPEWEDDGRASGLLIANDVDYRRAHMLVHQVKRLSSPNIIVTNHDATAFPSIKLPSAKGPDGEAIVNKYLKFDRILADVPCTGDGTCRKNTEIWRAWTPQNALGLHLTQIRILVRALQMLKVGGRVVYSTCSMNPVEDEAVVAAAVHRCGGLTKVDIKDCSDALPGLKRYPGFQKWKVMDRQGRMWNTFHEIERHRDTEGVSGLGRLNESMFPPEGEMGGISLDRCMRVYPHSHDTGAFFITILEKKSEIRALRQDHEYRKVDTTEASMQKIDDEELNQAEAILDLPETNEPMGGALVTNEQSQPANGQPASNDDQSTLNNSITKTQEEHAGHEKRDTPQEITVEEAQKGSGNGLKRKAEDEPLEQSPSKQVRLREEHTLGEKPVASSAQSSSQQDVDLEGAPSLNVQLASARNSQPHEAKTSASAAPSESLRSVAALENAGHVHPRANGEIGALAGKQKNKQPFEEPFKYIPPDKSELEVIRQFYSLSSRFPQDRFMVRNAMGTASKNIYYTTSLAKAILQENEGKGMKFVHAGVKMFVKQDVPRPEVCPWRIQTDGIPIIQAWVGEHRVVRLHSRKTLRKLLVEMFPSFDGDDWKELGEVGEQVKDLPMGCCVLRVQPGEGDDSISERMVFPLWKSIKSLNLMLPKEDRKAMLLRLFNDSTPLVNQSMQKQQTPKVPAEKANTSSPEPENTNGSTKDTDNAGADLLDVIENELDRRNDEAAMEAAQSVDDVPFDAALIIDDI
ncbi:MAG: hypothetical protein Q9160_009192 [Pyrenula sp. 1 TL-2023]